MSFLFCLFCFKNSRPRDPGACCLFFCPSFSVFSLSQILLFTFSCYRCSKPLRNEKSGTWPPPPSFTASSAKAHRVLLAGASSVQRESVSSAGRGADAIAMLFHVLPFIITCLIAPADDLKAAVFGAAQPPLIVCVIVVRLKGRIRFLSGVEIHKKLHDLGKFSLLQRVQPCQALL